MSPKPVQSPLPIWMGVGHPNAVRRAAAPRSDADAHPDRPRALAPGLGDIVPP